jgi:hypothetical protein
MILMWVTSISRAIGRGGGGLKIENFLGPEMATSEASPIWARKVETLKSLKSLERRK